MINKIIGWLSDAWDKSDPFSGANIVAFLTFVVGLSIVGLSAVSILYAMLMGVILFMTLYVGYKASVYLYNMVI
jgi:hypothetical protein